MENKSTVLFGFFTPYFPKPKKAISLDGSVINTDGLTKAQAVSWEKSCRDEYRLPNAQVELILEPDWTFPLNSVEQKELFANRSTVQKAITSSLLAKGADKEDLLVSVNKIKLIESSIGISRRIVFVMLYEGKYPFEKKEQNIFKKIFSPK